MKKLEDYVVSIPDYPEPGIIFRDVTSILQDAEGLKLAIDSLQAELDGLDFDVIAGTESRGFIFGMPIAYNLHKPFVLVRKTGKLPRETVSASYDLESGSAEIEMHKDDIILLCSDGLSNMIEDDDMEYIIKNSATLEEAGDKLIESANRNGGDDNITAVLAKIE